MSLQTIYVTRHGFRSNWAVEHDTGIYYSNIPSPTGIPSDPALTSYGAIQAQELAEKLITLDPPIERFYSSPFYRCIQTLYPTLEKLAAVQTNNGDANTDANANQNLILKVYGDNGLGEWFGTAPFEHPSPAPPHTLRRLFPRYATTYAPSIIPDPKGETIDALHDRTAYALHRIIERCDAEGVRAIAICTHAATLLALGRALTGRMPGDVGEEDFRTFTAGLTRFERRRGAGGGCGSRDASCDGGGARVENVPLWPGPGYPVPAVHWRDGRGVAGGWECVLNGDCSFLSGGEERGWRFSGDESFLASRGDAAGPGMDAGAALGIAVEGKRGKGARL